jgi:nucleoside-diphosphate-sugar epimerase
MMAVGVGTRLDPAGNAPPRLGHSGAPFLTRDSVRMAKKHTYFSSALAERELGFRSRPAEQAVRDALDWYRQHGYVS